LIELAISGYSLDIRSPNLGKLCAIYPNFG
jgi:hypothetical protein